MLARPTTAGPAGERDPRTRFHIQPTRLVWKTEDESLLRNVDVLLTPGSGQSTLWARPGCVMRRGGSAVPGFLLDFGRELNGGVQIVVGETPDHRPVRLRVRFGESVSEAMGSPNNDHAVHDVICRVAWAGTTEVGNTGFRFVRIDLEDAEGTEVEIKEVRAVALLRDLEYQGSFECSDERLNAIWRTGAYTVHLNMQDHVWDGIKRDRLVWIGDMHPETATIARVFGDTDIVPRSLDLARDETPLPRLMNGFSAYSLWWILIQRDWYLHFGNRAYLETQRKYLKGLIGVLEARIDGEGRETLPPLRFLDWPTARDEEALHAGLQALMVLAFRAAAELCGYLGEAAAARRCARAESRLLRHSPPAGPRKQVHAMKVLAGLADAAQTNRDVLARDPLKSLSTFYGYYVLQARAMAGDFAGCLEVMRRYWGGMLDLGATTFWEDFDLDWMDNAGRIDELVPEGKVDVHVTYGDHCYRGLRHSLCHGWASGPTAWLSEHVLGFRPLAPGSRVLAVQPHLGDLAWARGACPTPRGVVTVSHRRRADGSIRTQVKAPRGIKIRAPDGAVVTPA